MVFETCRGVPFKGHKSTVGCRLKEASEIGGGPGRKGGGGEGKPSPQCGLIHADGSANFGTMLRNSKSEKRWAPPGGGEFKPKGVV